MSLARVPDPPAGESGLIWQDPPPAQRRGAHQATKSMLAELRRWPGRWALVADERKSSSGALKWKKLGCEAVSRKKDDGSWGVWARCPA